MLGATVTEFDEAVLVVLTQARADLLAQRAVLVEERNKLDRAIAALDALVASGTLAPVRHHRSHQSRPPAQSQPGKERWSWYCAQSAQGTATHRLCKGWRGRLSARARCECPCHPEAN